MSAKPVRQTQTSPLDGDRPQDTRLAATPHVSSRRSLWRWSGGLATVLGASALLHLAVLRIPIAESIVQRPSRPQSPPAATSAGDQTSTPMNVSVLPSRLPAPDPEDSSTAPPLTPPPPFSPPVDPDPIASPPARQAGQNFSPPRPASALQPDPGLDAANDAAVAESVPRTTSVEEPMLAPPIADPATAKAHLLETLPLLPVANPALDQGLPTPVAFQQPGNAICFLDPAGGLASGVATFTRFEVDPTTLLNDYLPTAYPAEGLTFETSEPFCGETYIKAITASGEMAMALSLVSLEASTFLVMWDIPPQ